MPARSRARKRALDILFESEQQGLAPGATLSRHVAAAADQPINEYAITLVEGVIGNLERIDELLATYAEGWTLERMPAVDRNVLRIGAYEILYQDDVPDPVAISEAVVLVRDLSTDESPPFVNGLLARLASVKPSHSG